MAKTAGLSRSGGKRNLTIQLDEEVIQAAKELAARRNTSVSGLVAEKLKELVESDIRYEQAKQRALKAMDEATDLGGGTWNRDDLYEEMFNE
jgi:predicted transcriptional regulator